MRNWTVRERAGLAVIALAVIVGGLGVWALKTPDRTPAITAIAPPRTSIEIPARGGDDTVRITEPGEAPSAAVPDAPKVLVVDVQGAVRRPGVYTLKPGDRVYNAVRAAGGFKPNAAEGTVNLAELLRDGDQVYVAVRRSASASSPRTTTPPRSVAPDVSPPAPVRPARTADASAPKRGRMLGGAPPTAASPLAPSREGTKTAAAPEKAGKLQNPGDGFVNINAAGAEELQRLPGIGPAMAERILAHRQEFGAFRSPEQLLDVRGIGEKKYAALEPFVRVK